MNILELINMTATERRILELAQSLRAAAKVAMEDYGYDMLKDVVGHEAAMVGFVELGRGVYGMAFQHHEFPDKVFKLSCSEADGWVQYMRLVAKGDTMGGYAPRVYALTSAYRKNSTVGVVGVLDRLSPMHELDITDATYYSAHDEVSAKLYDLGIEWGHDLHRGNFMVHPTTLNLVCTDAIACYHVLYKLHTLRDRRREQRIQQRRLREATTRPLHSVYSTW